MKISTTEVLVDMYTAFFPFPIRRRFDKYWKLTGVYYEIDGEIIIEAQRKGFLSRFLRPVLIHEDQFVFRDVKKFSCRDSV